MPIISAAASSRLFCNASAYSLAASSTNLPNKASRLSLSLATRCARVCARWIVHEVANDVRPPIAVPASAAKADMYAASIGIRRLPPVALGVFSSKRAASCQVSSRRARVGGGSIRLKGFALVMVGAAYQDLAIGDHRHT